MDCFLRISFVPILLAMACAEKSLGQVRILGGGYITDSQALEWSCWHLTCHQ